MRKSLLLLMVTMMLPFYALAGTNYALTKTTNTTSQYSNSSPVEAQVVIHPTQAGISCPMANDDAHPYSIGFWFKTDAVYTYGNYDWCNLFGFGSAKDAGLWDGFWISHHSDGLLSFHVGADCTDKSVTGRENAFSNTASNAATYRTATAQLGNATLGEWHYLLMVADNPNKDFRIYVDGEQKYQVAQVMGFVLEGGAFKFGGFGFSGALDEIQIFDKALTAADAEVAHLSVKGMAGLAALYTFDDTTVENTYPNEASANPNYQAYYNQTTFSSYWAYVLPGEEEQFFGRGTANYTLGREIALDDANVSLEQAEGGVLTVTTADGTSYSGDDEFVVPGGSTIHFLAEPNAGYALEGIFVSSLLTGETVQVDNDSDYIVVGDIMISVVYSDNIHALTVTKDDDVEITLSAAGFEITDLESLIDDTDYVLTVNVPFAKTLVKVTLNGTDLTAEADGTYIINLSGDATLEVVTVEKPKYTVTLTQGANGTIAATYADGDNDVEINSGDQVVEGRVVTLTNTPDEGYMFVKYVVNGTNYTASSNVFTLSEDLNVTAEFEKAPELNPALTFKSVSYASQEDRFHVLMSAVGASSKTDLQKKSIGIGAWVRMTSQVRHTSLSGNYGGNDIFTYGMLNHMNQNGYISVYTDENGTLKVGGLGLENGQSLGCGGVTVDDVKIPLNEWHYVAVSVDFDSKNLDIYYDGELAKRVPFTGTQFQVLDDTPLGFGFGGNGYWGAIDDIHILNRAMTAEDAYMLYTEQAASVQGLAAWYTFNEVKEGTVNEFPNMVEGGESGTYDNVNTIISYAYSRKTNGTPDLTTINLQTQRIPVKLELDDARTVTVVSENEDYGTVEIVSPSTTETSVSTVQKVVNVRANAAEGYVFVNWTNEAGEVVSTDATYNYNGETDITLTAHFGCTFSFTVNGDGIARFATADGSVNSGDVVTPGTEVTATLVPGQNKIIESVMANGVRQTVENNTVTLTVERNTTVVVTFAEAKLAMNWVVEGKGTVRVFPEWGDNLDDLEAMGELTSGSMMPSSGYAFFIFIPEDGNDLESVIFTSGSLEEEWVAEYFESNADTPIEGIEADVYYSGELPVEDMSDNADLNISVKFAPVGSAINEIFGDEAEGNVEYFNLQGVKVAADNLTPGIYVARCGSKAAKVLVK